MAISKKKRRQIIVAVIENLIGVIAMLCGIAAFCGIANLVLRLFGVS